MKTSLRSKSEAEQGDDLFEATSPAWRLAHQQAAHIQNIKDRHAKRQQIAALCETWKLALKGAA